MTLSTSPQKYSTSKCALPPLRLSYLGTVSSPKAAGARGMSFAAVSGTAAATAIAADASSARVSATALSGMENSKTRDRSMREELQPV